MGQPMVMVSGMISNVPIDLVEFTVRVDESTATEVVQNAEQMGYLCVSADQSTIDETMTVLVFEYKGV